MTSLTCLTTKRRISALEDGELGRSAAEKVELHLAACRRCREYRDRLRAVNNTLGMATVAPTAEEVESFNRKVMAAIPTSGPGLRRLRLPGFYRTRRWVFLFPAGVAAVLVVALLLYRPVTVFEGRGKVLLQPASENGTAAGIPFYFANYIDRTVITLSKASMVLVQLLNLTPEDEKAFRIVQQEIVAIGLLESIGKLEAVYRSLPDPALAGLFSRIQIILVTAGNSTPGELRSIRREIIASGIVEEARRAMKELAEIRNWAAALPA